MATTNRLNIGGTVTYAYGSTTVTINLADSYTPTGSHFVEANESVPTGSWTTLPQGSNANNRYNFFVNTDLTSSCYISFSTASLSANSYAALLGPGDIAMVPNSGTCILYAQASGGHSPILLTYFAMEA